MEMADCEDIPDNLNNPLLERLFIEADTSKMGKDTKDNYMKSILGEAEYEANLEDWKAEGLEEGRMEGLKEGQEIGIRQGTQQGIQQGSHESAMQIASRLKSKGIANNVISLATGLAEEEISNI